MYSIGSYKTTDITGTAYDNAPGAGQLSIIGGHLSNGTFSITFKENITDLDGLGTGGLSYQWKYGEKLVSTSATYDLALTSLIFQDRRPKTITVTTSYVDGNGNQESVVDDLTARFFTATTTLHNLVGDVGIDILKSGTGIDTMTGKAGNDVYVINDVLDKIDDQGLKEDINTVLLTKSFNYVLDDEIANAYITTDGDTNLTGNLLNNTLSGNVGANLLDGGKGADTLLGGDGNDIYVINATRDKVIESVGSVAGIDTVQAAINYALGAGSHIENLTLTGKAIQAIGNELNNMITGNDIANILMGGEGSDTLNGGLGDDVLYAETIDDVIAAPSIKSSLTPSKDKLSGADNNDTLIGASGKDTLKGDSGNDMLDGKAGNDKLTGGSGSDIFVLSTLPNGSTNVDTITDFSISGDKIQIENSMFTALINPGALAANLFKSGAGVTAATDLDDYLIYDSSTGGLFYDAGGNAVGSPEAIKIAVLGINLALTSSHFSII